MDRNDGDIEEVENVWNEILQLEIEAWNKLTELTKVADGQLSEGCEKITKDFEELITSVKTEKNILNGATTTLKKKVSPIDDDGFMTPCDTKQECTLRTRARSQMDKLNAKLLELTTNADTYLKTTDVKEVDRLHLPKLKQRALGANQEWDYTFQSFIGALKWPVQEAINYLNQKEDGLQRKLEGVQHNFMRCGDDEAKLQKRKALYAVCEAVERAAMDINERMSGKFAQPTKKGDDIDNLLGEIEPHLDRINEIKTAAGRLKESIDAERTRILNKMKREVQREIRNAKTELKGATLTGEDALSRE
eukprot:GHVU01155446.1.p1 GENE.GHVU01155446.1~~GHVU01155446.1.p1  ORF type:complete len:306 (+),score=63.27 GHVU01155446.1:295-1212(+)